MNPLAIGQLGLAGAGTILDFLNKGLDRQSVELTNYENRVHDIEMWNRQSQWMQQNVDEERARQDDALSRNVNQLEKQGFNKMLAVGMQPGGGGTPSISGGTTPGIPTIGTLPSTDRLESALSKINEYELQNTQIEMNRQTIENLKATGTKISNEAEEILTNKRLKEEQILELKAQKMLTNAKTETERKQALYVAEMCAQVKQDIGIKEWDSVQSKFSREITRQQMNYIEEELRLKKDEFEERKDLNEHEKRMGYLNWGTNFIKTLMGIPTIETKPTPGYNGNSSGHRKKTRERL